MKTLVFNNSSGLLVELLTDLIDGNQQFTVYQIKERVLATKAFQIGLQDATIAAGWDFKVAEYDLGTMIAWAKSTGCTLTAVETGKVDEVVYQGTYYGGAIGVDILDTYIY
jgi:hypothetical protein